MYTLYYMNARILIAAPIYNGMDYIIDEFIQHILEIDYDNFDVLLVDNSDEDDFFNTLKQKYPKIKIIQLKSDENEKALNKIVKSRNKYLNYALENNYDYVLSLDADVLVPKNILKELLKQDKDVISGMYFNYFNIDKQLKLRPVAWKGITKEEFEDMKRIVNFPSSIKSHEDLRRHLTKEEWESGNVEEVNICSAGCMLIKRRVFEKVRYGLLDVPCGMHTSDDIYFLQKAREQEFKVYCHTGLRCRHEIKGKMKQEGNSLKNPAYE